MAALVHRLLCLIDWELKSFVFFSYSKHPAIYSDSSALASARIKSLNETLLVLLDLDTIFRLLRLQPSHLVSPTEAKKHWVDTAKKEIKSLHLAVL